MQLRRLRCSFLLFLGAFAAPPGSAAQDVEEILSYDVVVEVEPGGAMLVSEALRVRALGQEIRRGIYRDIPTSFPRARSLGRIEAPFAVLSVTRGGSPEPYSVQAIGGPSGRGGMRIRIGDADVVLDPGIYDYEIRYRTDRWIVFGDESDRLYWNVTGNGWGFPIVAASARLVLPEVTLPPLLESWTGYEGATESHAESSWDPGTRTATFRTLRALRPSEGLTVSLTTTSGQITPPSEIQRAEWFRLDWGGYVDAAWVVLLVIGVYLLMWRRVGVDPGSGPVRLRQEPPAGYSPAALGFIEKRGYDQSQLSAALVSMALKGAIRIEKNGKTKSWTLHDMGGGQGLSAEEEGLYKDLLAGRDRIELKQSRHSTLSKAIKNFRSSLARRLEREYFENNRRWFLAGLAVSLIGVLALAWRWRFDIEPPAIFLSIWLTGWTAGVATLGYRLATLVKQALTGGGAGAWIGAAALGLFSIPFFAGEVGVSILLLTMMPLHLVLAILLVGSINVLFYHLLERPTLKGRGVLDELDGFRAFVGEIEERPLPDVDRDISLFEQYLPFAISLGLAARWSSAFEDLLQPLMRGPDAARHMPWYHGGHQGFDAGTFATSLGSGLSSSLSAASSPPSSGGSSGGGGGGSSGGGGGGGGGGGW